MAGGAAHSPVPADLLLRDVTEDDLPILFDYQLDPEATRVAAFPSRDHDAFFAHWAKILIDDTIITQTVVVNGQVVGNIGSWEEESGRRVVGYWIGRSHWGQGIATRALSEFLGQVRVRPLYAHVAKHNVGSIRVLEKCGFSVSGEGTIPLAEGGEVDEFLMMLPGAAKCG